MIIGRIFVVKILVSYTCLSAQAQTDNRVAFGYNTFNEVYLAYEFPIRKETTIQQETRISVQAGYQFALKSEADYTWGPFEMTTPFLTNNASGVRMRAGYKFQHEKGFATLFLEYQNLQSNPFTYSTFSGSSMAPIYKFKEAYQKYGVRIMNATPIGGGRSVYLTYSVALFLSNIHRTDISMNGTPSTKESDAQTVSPQITFGLMFYLF